MSLEPPNLVGPILQSHLMRQEVEKLRRNEHADKTDTSRAPEAAGQDDRTVKTDDSDTRVFSDAKGLGSQGRDSCESQDEKRPPDDTGDPDPPTGTHIDVLA